MELCPTCRFAISSPDTEATEPVRLTFLVVPNPTTTTSSRLATTAVMTISNVRPDMVASALPYPINENTSVASAGERRANVPSGSVTAMACPTPFWLTVTPASALPSRSRTVPDTSTCCCACDRVAKASNRSTQHARALRYVRSFNAFISFIVWLNNLYVSYGLGLRAYRDDLTELAGEQLHTRQRKQVS